MIGMLDTNILIDFLHGYPDSTDWLLQHTEDQFGISSIVRMELVAGAKNKTEQIRATKLCLEFEIIYMNEEDALWAVQQSERFWLSHQIEIVDCFVVATAARLQLPIYTRNAQDFAVFPSVTTVIPYP